MILRTGITLVSEDHEPRRCPSHARLGEPPTPRVRDIGTNITFNTCIHTHSYTQKHSRLHSCLMSDSRLFKRQVLKFFRFNITSMTFTHSPTVIFIYLLTPYVPVIFH